jgi:hypothetical protein
MDWNIAIALAAGLTVGWCLRCLVDRANHKVKEYLDDLDEDYY